jgi:hypothetical protein
MIPFEVGMTLAKALEQEEPLREFLQQDSQAQEIWDMGRAARRRGAQRRQARRRRGDRPVKTHGFLAAVLRRQRFRPGHAV